MDDISNLSDEELAQLGASDAPDLSQISDEDLAALAPEPEVNSTDAQEVANATVQAEAATTDEGEFGPLQTAADFALGLGNRIPGAKQLSAAVGSVVFDEPFEQSLAETEAIANTSRERSPIATTAGELALDGTALIAGGGAAIGGLKALGVSGKIAAVAGAAATDFGLSFSQELTDARGLDDDSTLDSAAKAGKEALFGLVTGGALSKIGKAGGPIADRIVALNGFKNLETVRKQISIRTTNTGQSLQRFYKTLKKAGLGDDAVINNPAAADNIIRKTAPDRIGAQLDDAYAKIDSDKVKVDPTALYQDIENTIAEFASELPSGKLTPTAQRAKDSLLNKLGRFQSTGKEGQTVFVPNDKFSVKDLWEARRSIDTHFPAGKQKASRDALLRTLDSKRKEVLAKAINSGDDAIAKAAKDVNELSLDYGNLKFLQGQIGREGSSILGDEGKGLFGRFVSNISGATFSSGSIAGGIGYAAAGLPGVVAGVGATLGVNTLINAPKFLRRAQVVSSAADNAILNHAEVVSASVSSLVDLATGDKQSPAAAALVAKINNEFASQELTEEKIAELSDLTSSTVSLIKNPLERTEAAFKARSKDILRIAKQVNPKIANQMINMIRNGEPIGPLMEQVANHPAARELIQPGQGWEGKTYDPATKKQIAGQLRAARDVPAAARIAAEEALIKDGIIPDPNALPKRQQTIYNPRDKKKERF